MKISVIVFWFMIAAGTLISFYLLQGREQKIAENYTERANGLTYDLTIFLQGQEKIIQEILDEKLQQLTRRYQADYVEIKVKDEIYKYGQEDPDLAKYARSFDYHVAGKRYLEGSGSLLVGFPSLQNTVALERKRVLLFMGLGLLVFGLWLHWALRRILTQPFHQMVETARSITQGETSRRFAENRTDEFGFLARFINQALDFVTMNQKELSVALQQVRESEANLLDEKNLIEVTLHSIGDAVITTDAAGRVQYFNPTAEQLTGRILNEVNGKWVGQAIQLISEEHRLPVETPVQACLQEEGVVCTLDHTMLVRPDGSEVEVVCTAAPIRKAAGGPLIGVVLVIHDASRARKMARQLSYQASHDDLTGLANRREFERVLAKAIAVAEPGKNEHALCYMDLDQFKVVNDTCGHIAGDELLRQIAELLRGRIRNTDIVARLGGDEFGVLFQHCHVDVAKRIAESLLEKLKEFHFVWKEHTFDIGASIGLVSIVSPDQTIADIMSAADVACYAAKDAGRHRIHLYLDDDDELKQRHGEMRWVSRLKKALDEDRFRLYCQKIAPVENIHKGVPHYELLIRLLDEDGKLVPPLAFIPAAERFNLMTLIDRWVVTNAFDILSANASIVSAWQFSINLSGQSLCDESFLSFVVDAFDRTGISPDRICFEITETTAMANLARATRFVSVLKGMGVKFSLDDFGTGLSSFGYLQALKVDYLKIDGSFVRDIATNSVNRSIVEAANRIGHAMGMQTVAEFVENDEILEALGTIGVNFAQGYGVAKPMPFQEVISGGETLSAPRSVEIQTPVPARLGKAK